MSSMGRRIKESREAKGIYQAQLAEMIGVKSSGVISNWEKDINKPDADKIVRLCQALEISASYLLDYYGGNDKNEAITSGVVKRKNAAPKTDTAENIAKRYRKLDDHGKLVVCAVVSEEERRMQALQKPAPEDNVIHVHWNDQPASAGEGFDLSDEHMHQWTVRYNELTRKADFCLDVQGHSMEPKFHDGDTVLVRQQPSVDIGEIGLFIMDGKGYIKKQGSDRLISLNPNYDDVWPNEFSNFRCVGKVLGVLKPEWIISR